MPELSRAIDFECYGGMKAFFERIVDDSARELSNVNVNLGSTIVSQCGVERLREMMTTVNLPMPVLALVERHFGLKMSRNVGDNCFPHQIDIVVSQGEKLELNYIFVVDDKDLHNEIALRQLKPRDATQQCNWSLPIVLMGSVSVQHRNGSFTLETYHADAFGHTLENETVIGLKHDKSHALFTNLKCAIDIVRKKGANERIVANSRDWENLISETVSCMCIICFVALVALFVLFVVV